MTPNIVSIIRVVLVFLTIGFFTLNANFAIVAFFLTIIVIYMDSLDGYLARKLNVASDFGALLDIAGDRIVENTFWIFFAAHGDISFWIPIIIVTRGFLVDMVRSIAFSEGKTPFGEKTMMRSKITRFLVASPFSRSSYAINKVLAFCWLGGLIAITKGIDVDYWTISNSILDTLNILGQVFAYLALIFCILRGLPVLWDGKELVLAKKYPKEFNKGD
jgi:CDP-diacylglycerol---glycerol-3-phosphate 3-phosphatidyltransferase